MHIRAKVSLGSRDGTRAETPRESRQLNPGFPGGGQGGTRALTPAPRLARLFLALTLWCCRLEILNHVLQEVLRFHFTLLPLPQRKSLRSQSCLAPQAQDIEIKGLRPLPRVPIYSRASHLRHC